MHDALPPDSPRSVPYDLEAERAVLGSILLDREAILTVLPWLKPEHFYLEKHGRVFAAAEACYRRREPPDLTTIAGELRRQGHLEAVGGMFFLGDLLADIPTALHIEYYARTVEQAAAGRALIEAGGQIVALGFEASRPIAERITDAAKTLYDLSAERALGADFVPMAEVASRYLEEVSRSDEAEDGLLGLATGYGDLDQITLGMKPGELVVLAARPGVGKTALALSIALNTAQRGYGVGIFSLEMRETLLLQRMVANLTGIDSKRIPGLLRRGDERVIRAMGTLSNLPIEINDTAELTTHGIRDAAMRLQARAPVALWVVDYLQLVKGLNQRDDDVRRITQISQGLTHLAREFDTPVLALSQLSREVEKRASNVPQLSDLRGSGSIEQDASQVWFIYREELYDEETDRRGIAEIHVAKHRNGDTGVAELRFERATTRFVSLERYREVEGY